MELQYQKESHRELRFASMQAEIKKTVKAPIERLKARTKSRQDFRKQ